MGKVILSALWDSGDHTGHRLLDPELGPAGTADPPVVFSLVAGILSRGRWYGPVADRFLAHEPQSCGLRALLFPFRSGLVDLRGLEPDHAKLVLPGP